MLFLFYFRDLLVGWGLFWARDLTEPFLTGMVRLVLRMLVQERGLSIRRYY